MTGLKPFFCYYGGKWRAAPLYPVPRHNRIIEPFAGSAGYSLRYPSKDIHLYDTNPIVAGLWKYLISVSASEIMGLPSDVESTDDLNCCQEAKWLIGFWMQTGRPSPRVKKAKREKVLRNGRLVNKRRQLEWCQTVKERIAFQVDLIRHWKAFHDEYSVAENIESTWFIDPPYNNKDGLAYTSKFYDYSTLSDWCKSRAGQVIVCENQGAGWLDFKPFGTIQAANGLSKEVIWTNDLGTIVPTEELACKV